MIARYPSEIIVEDSDGNAAVTVRIFSKRAAVVTLDRGTNAREWKEISAQVLAALLEMRLDGDDAE